MLTEELQKNPASKKALGTYAKQLGVSERSLIRMIRSETGMTFRELRRHCRIMVAIEKLSDGDQITRVALEVGFETPSAFSQSFRIVTGETPRQFLKTEEP